MIGEKTEKCDSWARKKVNRKRSTMNQMFNQQVRTSNNDNKYTKESTGKRWL